MANSGRKLLPGAEACEVVLQPAAEQLEAEVNTEYGERERERRVRNAQHNPHYAFAQRTWGCTKNISFGLWLNFDVLIGSMMPRRSDCRCR